MKKSDMPFELRAINVDTVAALLGVAPRTVLEKVSCAPTFPARLTQRPATWVAGEVIKWRDENRAYQPNHRQKPRNRTTGS